MDCNPGFIHQRIQEMLSSSRPYNCSRVKAMLDRTSSLSRPLCVGLISSTSPPVLKRSLEQMTMGALQTSTTLLFHAPKENADFSCISLLMIRAYTLFSCFEYQAKLIFFLNNTFYLSTLAQSITNPAYMDVYFNLLWKVTIKVLYI